MVSFTQKTMYNQDCNLNAKYTTDVVDQKMSWCPVLLHAKKKKKNFQTAYKAANVSKSHI